MDRNYKILYITSHSSMQGGGQRSLYLLIKYLNKSIYTPLVLVPKEGALSHEVNGLDIETMSLYFSRLKTLNPCRILITMVKLMRIISKNGIHLIHTDSPRETIYAVIAGKLLRIPVVCHLRVSGKDMVDKIIYHLADCFIAVSYTVRERFADIGPMQKIAVVYNGVELDRFKIDSHTHRKPAPTLQVGYFGRIDKEKGVDVLLRATSLVRDRVSLLVMGDGEESYVSELKKLSEGTGTIFRNYRSDILKDMSSMDVIVLPSYSEGLSRLIIESMAMGKVIVVSDIKENLEAVGEDLKKFSFPAGDYGELAKVLKSLTINRNILDEIKQLSRKRAELLFDIRKNTRQIEQIYEKLLTQ
ncbi:MAG: glycosyltransferase family 4 protein [Planctomycetes bacterium]|nr:glycosyltransferase family 4 protein [Planctomycetota bacterium]